MLKSAFEFSIDLHYLFVDLKKAYGRMDRLGITEKSRPTSKNDSRKYNVSNKPTKSHLKGI